MRFLVLIFTVLSMSHVVNAERFNSYFQSLDKNFPINTTFMQWVLKTHKTKLAHPSLLEQWGVINQDAAATYNSILNTIILKGEYTIDETDAQGANRRRIKTVSELEQAEPSVWSVRAATIFHELSHAEYSWLARSKDPVDIEILKVLNTEFERYLKLNHPKLSMLERKIARSELFAYFRGDFITLMVQTWDEIMLENGYFKTNGTCKNTRFLMTRLSEHPEADASKFLTFGNDVDFTKVALPVIFVKGTDIEIDANKPAEPILRGMLWKHMTHHLNPAKSKSEMIRWMNTQPELLKLIQPCRSQLVAQN